jgi:putative intracellular protease/amidase
MTDKSVTAKTKVIIPLPNTDFDPTEVAIPWQMLTKAGYVVEFATVDGQRGHCDPLMLSGEGLDPWGWVPLLKKVRLIGLMLRADRRGRAAYRALEADSNFNHPKTFAQINPEDYGGLFLPGGHASGVKVCYENSQLHQFVAAFFESLNEQGQHKPIGAVCHGVLLAARAISPTTGRSVLYGKKTTALTWQFEQTAWRLTRFFARFWDPTYYRTYSENKGDPKAHWSVQSEVQRALARDEDFVDVTKGTEYFWQKTAGLFRDNLDNDKSAWVVQDGNYLSARWPGDMHTLSGRFVQLLEEEK